MTPTECVPRIEAGADGIITDYPTRLRAVMAQFAMPLPPPYHRLS
jgi:glycerophosphoryl diester phosphodiesterase